MKDFIRNKWGKNANAGNLAEYFGVRPGGHLPNRHMEIFVDGVRLVLMTREEARAHGYTLIRTFEECPFCHELIPAGRIHQHIKVHPEYKVRLGPDAECFYCSQRVSEDEDFKLGTDKKTVAHAICVIGKDD